MDKLLCAPRMPVPQSDLGSMLGLLPQLQPDNKQTAAVQLQCLLRSPHNTMKRLATTLGRTTRVRNLLRPAGYVPSSRRSLQAKCIS